MARVRLFHWKPAEAAACVEALEAAGHTAIYHPPTQHSSLSGWRDDAPDAFVIDLSRSPSHGRAIGMALRKSSASRALPLVFAGGADDKVSVVRATLPDAVFTPWSEIAESLRAAFAHPVAAPIVPKEMPGATQTTLTAKLGIRANKRVLTLNPPAGFVDWLGALPDGAELVTRGRHDMVIWFVESAEDLEQDIARVVTRAAGSPLWIAWPRRRPDRDRGELTMNVVMAVGAALGMSQYKICAIHETWSGMVFRTEDAATEGSLDP